MYSAKKQLGIDWWFTFLFCVCFIKSTLCASFVQNNVKLAYDIFLPPEQEKAPLPPIILLHGIMDWRKTWNRFGPEIAKITRRKIYAYDARNNGDSDWDDDFNVEINVFDLDQFMKYLNISKAILIGHSMGGRTAMAFAKEKPEKVEKLIIEDMPCQNLSPQKLNYVKQGTILFKELLNEIPDGADELMARESIIDVIGSFITVGLNKDFLMAWLPITVRDGAFAWKANIDFFQKVLKSRDPFYYNISGVFEGETLFLYGSASPFGVKEDPSVLKHFPRARKVGFEEGQHWIHFQFPLEFERVISKFINE